MSRRKKEVVVEQPKMVQVILTEIEAASVVFSLIRFLLTPQENMLPMITIPENRIQPTVEKQGE